MVSSFTLDMVENSCWTPSMRTEVTAAPGRELRSTRRRALPRVMPKPEANGAATMRAQSSPISSTSMFGSVGCSSTTGGAGTPG